MNKQIFGTYIAENRKQLGMTQAQLADRLHVTDKAVSKWERGLSYPDVTLLEPLAEALSVSIDALLRCRMPADEGKEQTMTEERNSEPIQTVMEISKETVQRKKLGSKLLAAALAVVIAAAGVLVIPRAVREYRAAQEAKHHHEVNCAKVDMIYVEQMPGSENSGEYICVVGYEGKLLYLHYDGGLSDKELLPPDTSWEDSENIGLRPGIEWTQSYLRFTYDDRTGGGAYRHSGADYADGEANCGGQYRNGEAPLWPGEHLSYAGRERESFILPAFGASGWGKNAL